MINLINPDNEKAKIILHLRIGVNNINEYINELCPELKKNGKDNLQLILIIYRFECNFYM